MGRILREAVAVRNPDTGQVEVLLPGTEAPDWAEIDNEAVFEPSGYLAMKVDDLKAEIVRRNEGRDDADKLSTEGKKAELIAALAADDK